MTKKEELLEFIEENVNDSNELQLRTTIQETNEDCIMGIGARKERVIQIFTENFTEELIGSLPNDQMTHKVESWLLVNKAS